MKVNPNPVKARLAKQKKGRARRTKGSLGQVQGLLWAALERAGELLDDPNPVHALKAVHAISTGAGAYARVVEVGELAARLDALESRLAAPTGQGEG